MRRLGVLLVAASLSGCLVGPEYERPQQPYLPVIATEKVADRGDFDHLARLDEWALAGGDTS